MAPEEMKVEEGPGREHMTFITHKRTVGEALKSDYEQNRQDACNIPPTQEALIQHAKLALYQAGYIWRQARQRHQDVPHASAWGWTQDVNTKLWVPFWTVLDDASKACALLHHCECGKACRGNCTCARAGIKCTILRNCEGGCINNDGV